MSPTTAALPVLCKPTPGVKLFKPSEMMRKVSGGTENLPRTAHESVPADSLASPLNNLHSAEALPQANTDTETLFDLVRDGKAPHCSGSKTGQMPILLENPKPEPIKYIVGSQLKSDEIPLPVSSVEVDPGKNISEPEKETKCAPASLLAESSLREKVEQVEEAKELENQKVTEEKAEEPATNQEIIKNSELPKELKLSTCQLLSRKRNNCPTSLPT